MRIFSCVHNVPLTSLSFWLRIKGISLN